MAIKNMLLIIVLFITQTFFSQSTLIDHLSGVDKGEFIILEIRLNIEDEFRTLEAKESPGLARLSLFNGHEDNKPLLTKGFEGYDQVVRFLNELKGNGFKLSETYSIRGESLLITHYVLEKVKK